MVIKRILKIFLIVIVSILLIAIGYVGYVLIQYNRIEDNVVLDIIDNESAKDEDIKLDTTYTVVSYNIGFGAYLQDYTFFLDGGYESWARSEELVISNINDIADNVASLNPDFVFFQELDLDSTRTYHVNEKDLIDEKFPSFSSVVAINYHSAFLMYPFYKPHGASNSSMVTYSKYQLTSSLRRSLPISTTLSKLVDLDRCYTVSRIPTENGKELVLYNVHFSAYGSSDEIRTGQMSMLFGDMKAEYEKGNYCVCGGDFNHDFTGTSTQELNGGATVDFGWAQPFPSDLLAEYEGIKRCDNYSSGIIEPTCRNCDVPYEKGNFTIVVDGFLVSDNVEIVYLENIQTDFMYSDHNPVILKFSLK